MDEIKRIACGEYIFEVIDEIPCGYEFWNIGKNMIEGYLPLCRLSAIQPFEGGRCVDVDSLKAIKLDGAQTVLAASIHGQTSVEAMEKYLARYQGKRVNESTLRQMRRIAAALDVLKEVRRPMVPVKRNAQDEQIPECRFELGDKVKIPYISDKDSRNDIIGEVTWIHPYKYYPEGDKNNYVWKHQMEITYPGGQSIMADPERKNSGIASAVVLVEAKAPQQPLDNIIRSATSRISVHQPVSDVRAKEFELEI